MLSELQGRLMENDPPYIPPVISAPGFDARAEERVCINGCLYLRADFAGKMCAPDEQAKAHGIAEGMEQAAVIAGSHGFLLDMDEWRRMTKKEISAFTCRSVAASIRAAKGAQHD